VTTARRHRITGALGIASAPLLIAGFLLIAVAIPAADDSDREFVAYFTENTAEIWAGAALTTIGVVAFLAFLARLRGALVSSGLMLAAGTAWVLFTLAGTTIYAGTAGAADYFDGFILDPDTARLMIGMGWLPSIYAGFAATVTIAAGSLSALRTGALPTAMARAGFAIAALAFVASFMGVAGFLLAIWTVMVGVVLVARARGEHRSAAGPHPAAGAAV
jgi:hypothetical protein